MKQALAGFGWRDAARRAAQHGFEGTSAQMLVDAMGIGRQSLCAAFGGEYRLADTAKAHANMESRKTTGKLVLMP